MFEVFYTVHVYSAILFIVVTLWHATQAWRYLVPCLFLYTIDRCLRFYNSTNFARIDNMEVIKLGASNNLEQVTKIAFRIAQFGTTLDGDTRAFYGNIRFKMGQYCFIHIPQISPLEWHPFTISSGPYDRQATFHIKVMFCVFSGFLLHAMFKFLFFFVFVVFVTHTHHTTVDGR